MDLSALLPSARARILLWCAHVVRDSIATPQHIFFSIAVQLDLHVLLPVFLSSTLGSILEEWSRQQADIYSSIQHMSAC